MTLHEQIRHALRSGPTDEGFLSLVLGYSIRELHATLSSMVADGDVERVPEIGPYTYRLVTPKGDS